MKRRWMAALTAASVLTATAAAYANPRLPFRPQGWSYDFKDSPGAAQPAPAPPPAAQQATPTVTLEPKPKPFVPRIATTKAKKPAAVASRKPARKSAPLPEKEEVTAAFAPPPIIPEQAPAEAVPAAAPDQVATWEPPTAPAPEPVKPTPPARVAQVDFGTVMDTAEEKRLQQALLQKADQMRRDGVGVSR